jgi:hypothetical protein
VPTPFLGRGSYSPSSQYFNQTDLTAVLETLWLLPKAEYNPRGTSPVTEVAPFFIKLSISNWVKSDDRDAPL